jgi:hypothetical protein
MFIPVFLQGLIELHTYCCLSLNHHLPLLTWWEELLMYQGRPEKRIFPGVARFPAYQIPFFFSFEHAIIPDLRDEVGSTIFWGNFLQSVHTRDRPYI